MIIRATAAQHQCVGFFSTGQCILSIWNATSHSALFVVQSQRWRHLLEVSLMTKCKLNVDMMYYSLPISPTCSPVHHWLNSCNNIHWVPEVKLRDICVFWLIVRNCFFSVPVLCAVAVGSYYHNHISVWLCPRGSVPLCSNGCTSERRLWRRCPLQVRTQVPVAQN